MVAITVIIFWASNPWQQGKEAFCHQSCWLHTKFKYYRKSLFSRLTIIPQDKKKIQIQRQRKLEEWFLICTVQLIQQIRLQGWRMGLGTVFLIQLLNQISFDFHTNNLFQSTPYFPISLFCQRCLQNSPGYTGSLKHTPKTLSSSQTSQEHIISHHVISYHIISHHIILYNITSFNIIS